MNKADKAIIMAAGLGKRMQPITNSIPKPMIRVNGIRMIDTVIDALHENGIFEIYIVVGYLKEAFNELTNKYKDIIFIENPYYETCNNISSLYVARKHLGNCIILDGDQIIYNKDILKPEFGKSGYCSVWTDDYTEEWLQTVENDKVVSCSRTGGTQGWQLFSVSFWSLQDGERLRNLLVKEFELNHNTDIYWDDIAMFCYPKQFDLSIRKIDKGDIIEIDNYEELIALDADYRKL